jgi:hypothetical protein
MSNIEADAAARANALRIAAHVAELETLRLLAVPLEPPDPVRVIDARRAQLDVAYAREWEEHAAAARVQYEAADAVLAEARATSVGVYGELK